MTEATQQQQQVVQSFPGDSIVKNLPAAQENACNTGDAVSIPGLGRFPGEGNGKPLQYSCLGNPIDEEWQATVCWVAEESDMTQLLNNN